MIIVIATMSTMVKLNEGMNALSNPSDMTPFKVASDVVRVMFQQSNIVTFLQSEMFNNSIGVVNVKFKISNLISDASSF